MIFIYYKVIYFCSLNIYLDSHKGRTIILQCCYFAVAGWQCCYYVACSLLVVTAGLFLIHCRNCWKKKDSILVARLEKWVLVAEISVLNRFHIRLAPIACIWKNWHFLILYAIAIYITNDLHCHYERLLADKNY